jgi:hypothetical protein
VVTCSGDFDFVGGLLPVAGDLETALLLVTTPDSESFNDLVVRSTPVDITNRSPLDITFLTTRRGPVLSVHSFHFPFIRGDSR